MGYKKDFEKLGSMTFGGAALVKGTDVLAHARNPTALAGDVGGLASVGIAGAFGQATLRMATRGYGKRRHRKR